MSNSTSTSTATSSSAPARLQGTPNHWALRRTTLAGFVFSASWLIGLIAFSTSTTVGYSGGQIIAAYAGRESVGVLQFLFTEGLPPVAILIVVGALARSMREAGYIRLGSATWIAALIAAIVSFVQFVLGVILVTVAVPARDTGSAVVLFDSVNRLDGAKMLLFASMAVTSLIYLVAARRGKLVWLRIVSGLLAVTIATSGLGYLLLLTTLATAADASLPLLLVWTTGFAIVLGRNGY
jgi:hypothetical protein